MISFYFNTHGTYETKPNCVPPTNRKSPMAKRNTNLLTTILLAASLTSLTSTAQADRPTAVERAQKIRDRQIEAIEQKLCKLHGIDTCYVFQIGSIRPEVSSTLTRVISGNSFRDYASVSIQQRAETRSTVVEGHAAAAKMIWQCDRSPVHYQYRVLNPKTDITTSKQP